MHAATNLVMTTAKCQQEADLLRAYCEQRFPIGDGAVIPEACVELCSGWSRSFASPAAAREAAQERFDRFADGKIGVLYWRVTPEIAFATRRKRYAYYMRLLISDKKARSTKLTPAG